MGNRNSKTYTTGEIAKICHVTKRTVINWFDSGKLQGFSLPGSNHRRIPERELFQFMKRNRIPHPSLDRPRQRILIVDDDPDLVELLRDMLSAQYDLAVAYSALEAATLLSRFKPDLLLLDVRLPDLSGFDLCRHAQSDPDHKKIPILMMSAYGSELETEEVKRIGANDFVSKPLKIVDLEKRISRLVG